MTAETALTAEEIAHYQAAVGRHMEETATLAPEIAARFSSTLGDVHFPTRDTLALGRQWGFFLPVVTKGTTGTDGHPVRGGFIPAIRLERRMFAGGAMERLGEVQLGVETAKTTTIESVERKAGAQGELIFVEVVMAFAQGGHPVLRERQTIVYLDPGDPVPLPTPVAEAELPTGDAVEDFTPNEVDLFRFSAVTFNGHRIHYDQPYATGVEGYPALVVHGPLIASKLLDLAMRTKGRNADRFSFRARRPAFVNQPLRFIADADGDGYQLRAVRADGQVAMTAEVGFTGAG
jgi:3-methylfumaryl-CoA hydratase